VFAPIGEIKATGLTAKQLADRMGDRLSTYLRQTTTVTVTVSQYLSHSVFVTGAVARPGRYGFEKIPSLLDVISAAGGALPNADLSRVQVLRRQGAALQTLAADVTSAMQQGSEQSLPNLSAGDVVLVPSSSIGGAVTIDAVGVLGEINRPGIYQVGDGQDLWMVLAQAGGPTNRTNLGDIKVLTRNHDVASAITVDLKETLNRGNRIPYVVKPGDIVYLHARGATFWSGFLTLLGVTRDVASLVAVIRVLENTHN